jgi:hypothetical protein
MAKGTLTTNKEGRTMKKDITVKIDTVNGLNSQTGKSEEIEILSLITERMAGTQTYLESLFDAALLDWFKGQVHDDFCPNIIASYYAEQETNRNLNSELQKSNLIIESMEKQIESNKDNARALLAGKDKAIEQGAELLNSRQINLAACQVALGDERRIKEAITSERDELSNQVIKLKAMLFDLQNNLAA